MFTFSEVLYFIWLNFVIQQIHVVCSIRGINLIILKLKTLAWKVVGNSEDYYLDIADWIDM